MTNRNVVKPEQPASAQHPNATPLPAMPADESSETPTTAVEPIDSPQPNRSAKRRAPEKGETGLGAARET